MRARFKKQGERERAMSSFKKSSSCRPLALCQINAEGVVVDELSGYARQIQSLFIARQMNECPRIHVSSRSSSETNSLCSSCQ